MKKVKKPIQIADMQMVKAGFVRAWMSHSTTTRTYFNIAIPQGYRIERIAFTNPRKGSGQAIRITVDKDTE